MSKVLVNESTLSSIAGAVRDKTGTTNTYKPAEMAEAIQSISASGGALDKDFSGRLIFGYLTDNEINTLLADAVGYEFWREDDIVAPSVVNQIYPYRFYYFDGFKNLIIPTGFIEIDEFAFSRVYSLKTVNLPNGLERIGRYAFSQCFSLTEIEIPASVIEVQQGAFEQCSALTKIVFKGTPTELDKYAFVNCKAITDIYVPWAEGAIADAPWGATNATVHYNYAG